MISSRIVVYKSHPLYQTHILLCGESYTLYEEAIREHIHSNTSITIVVKFLQKMWLQHKRKQGNLETYYTEDENEPQSTKVLCQAHCSIYHRNNSLKVSHRTLQGHQNDNNFMAFLYQEEMSSHHRRSVKPHQMLINHQRSNLYLKARKI